ncbi:ketosteroid isomerase-like protein [Paraburkholderia bannensis]|uniref:Ketosteroid isomerase-like protein n=1 Tax=Paraburkholderia bannensis TaxID=765414 RepID=A0A7W9WR60_9BURK|nr:MULTISPECIES: nuclear transport factor 2 family protein [Paraburkholderia]MBB3257812.1 ketosteroid isomerase-like protein [Paraburkholderia sp. WP4_3_2]MBB6102825.1 ketosteroid isomerase-like protein [Paraburkholderia bannensis]
MKHTLILLATGALTITAAANPAPAGVSPISDTLQVQLLEHQWTQAASAGDRSMLNDLLDDKFFEVFPGEIRRDKREMLAATAMPTGGSQVLEDVRVQVLDNVAVATGINRYTPALGYKAIEYRFTDVFVKREDGWRVAASRMRRKETGSI